MSDTTEVTRPDGPAPCDAAPAPLQKIAIVLRDLDRAGIRYCHWKSNYRIQQALAGEGDLDLLVDQEDFAAFVTILLQQGFKQAESATSRRQPGVFHFLGNDDATRGLINVHAYVRILTGDHLLKTWALPLERLLLSDTRRAHGICLPSKAAELVVFVLRDMIKHTTLLDIYLGRRSRKAVLEEHRWLVCDSRIEDCYGKLATYFPMISPAAFRSALELIGTEGAMLRRIRMGFRFQRALTRYRRYGRARQIWWTAASLCGTAIRKLCRSQKTMTLRTGGAIIAVVGPQAAGRAVLVEKIRQWLGRQLSVRVIHAGEPPATWLSYLPRKCTAMVRRLVPGQAARNLDGSADQQDEGRVAYLHLIGKLMLAHERRTLLRRAYRDSRNGEIIVSEGYPSENPAAIGGPGLCTETIEAQTFPLKRRLLQWEAGVYRNVCPPDVVLELRVGVDKAVERNRVRNNQTDPQAEYVRQREAVQHQPPFHGCPVISISTDRDLEETLLEVRRAIWEHL